MCLAVGWLVGGICSSGLATFVKQHYRCCCCFHYCISVAWLLPGYIPHKTVPRGTCCTSEGTCCTLRGHMLYFRGWCDENSSGGTSHYGTTCNCSVAGYIECREWGYLIPRYHMQLQCCWVYGVQRVQRRAGRWGVPGTVADLTDSLKAPYKFPALHVWRNLMPACLPGPG